MLESTKQTVVLIDHPNVVGYGFTKNTNRRLKQIIIALSHAVDCHVIRNNRVPVQYDHLLCTIFYYKNIDN